MRYVLAVFLDCLFITAIVAALFILLTGGGVYTIGHLRVSARGPDNLLLLMAVIFDALPRIYTSETALRSLLRPQCPDHIHP